MATNQPTDMLTWLLQQPNIPQRLWNTGFWGAFINQALVVPTNVLMAAAASSVYGAQQNDPESPDDVLPILGVADRLPQYATETNAAYRLRLQQKWNIFAAMTQPLTIPAQCALAGFTNVTLAYNLAGGGNYQDDQGRPLFNVPPYPPSSYWWSQFITNVTLSASMGTGADGYSKLLNQTQLETIRLIVNQFRPAKWVCREILVQINGTGQIYDDNFAYETGLLYDQPETYQTERFHA